MAEYIGSEIGLPYLDMLPDGAAPQPQASLLPQPQAQRYFISVSISLSLFKTLSVIVCCFSLALVDKFINIYPFFVFIRWYWCW